MNDLEFKRHLKDLVHGHHHPEEHDWREQPAAAKPAARARSSKPARRASRRAPKKK